MFSARNLFDSPKLIILAELTSPAANFNSHQPQIRAPGCNWLFFSDYQIAKIMEPSHELSLVPRELTNRALNIGFVRVRFYFLTKVLVEKPVQIPDKKLRFLTPKMQNRLLNYSANPSSSRAAIQLKSQRQSRAAVQLKNYEKTRF